MNNLLINILLNLAVAFGLIGGGVLVWWLFCLLFVTNWRKDDDE